MIFRSAKFTGDKPVAMVRAAHAAARGTARDGTGRGGRGGEKSDSGFGPVRCGAVQSRSELLNDPLNRTRKSSKPERVE